MKTAKLSPQGRKTFDVWKESLHGTNAVLIFGDPDKLLNVAGDQVYIEVEGRRFEDGQPRRLDFGPKEFYLWDPENPVLSDWAITDWKKPRYFDVGTRAGQPDGTETLVTANFDIVDRAYHAVSVDGIPWSTSYNDTVRYADGEWNRYDAYVDDGKGNLRFVGLHFLYRSPSDMPREVPNISRYKRIVLRRGLYISLTVNDRTILEWVPYHRVEAGYIKWLQETLRHAAPVRVQKEFLWPDRLEFPAVEVAHE